MFLLHHVPDQTSLGTYMDHTDVIRRRSRLMIDYLLQVETETGSHCKAAVMHTWPISRSACSRIRGQALRPMLTFSPLPADNAGMSNGLKLVLNVSPQILSSVAKTIFLQFVISTNSGCPDQPLAKT